MENNFKRFLSLVVAMVMVFSMIPTTVFAADADTTVTYVAQVGNTQYESLQDAVDAAQTDDIVVLLSNITLTDDDMTQSADGLPVMIHVTGKSITLDLNEKTITVDYNGGQYLYAAVLVADGASLTVTGNGGINIPDNGENVAYMFWKRGTTGTLVVENGTYHMNASADSMVYTNGNEIVTIAGGTWTLDALDNEKSPWIFNVKGSGDNHVFVTGGTFNYNVQRQKWANEVMVPTTHYIVDNGNGTWTVNEGATLYAKEGILTGGYYVEDWSIGYPSLEAFVAAANANAEDTIDLYDPIVISNDVSTYKAKGYKLVANEDSETYSVVEYAEPVAKIGDVEYTSIQAAVEAAEDGATITVIADHEMDCGNLVLNSGGYSTLVNVAEKAVTIDLNGKTITVGPKAEQFADAKDTMLMAVFAVDTNGTLTLKDSIGTGKVAVTANDATVYSLAICYGVGGKLNIESGSYSLDVGGNGRGMIYAQYGEVVTITGGNFHLGNVGALDNGSPWIFNVKGSGDSHVFVTGGTFNANVQRQHWVNEVKVPVTHYVQDNGNGTWTVKEGATLYAIEGALTGPYYVADWTCGYPSLEAFIAAVVNDTSNGNTIDLEDRLFLFNDPSTYKAEGYKLVANDDGTWNVVEDPTSGMVAQVGNDYYDSLQKALDACTGGETVILLSDINVADVAIEMLGGKYNTLFHVAGKSVTVNMNGKTISGAYNGDSMLVGVFSTEKDGHLTLTGNGTIDVTAAATVYSLLVSYDETSSLTVENGTYTLDKASDSLIYTGGVENVTVMDGNFHLGNVGTGSNGSPWIFNVKGSGDSHVTVTGGTFNANIQRQHWVNEVMVPVTHYVQDNGNGTWTVNEGATLYAIEGALTGPYYVEDWAIGYPDLEAFIAAAKNDTTNGNTIDLDDPIVLKNDVSTYKAEGYKLVANNDGTWNVVEDPTSGMVAQVGNDYYETLKDAVAAANAIEGGATVTLLKDVTLGEKLTVSGNVTIEGEYTITRDDAYTGTFFDVKSGAVLTLDGGLVIDGANNYAFNTELYNADLEAKASVPKEDAAKYFTPEEGAPVASAYMITIAKGTVDLNGTVNLNNVTIQNNYSTGSGIVSAGEYSTINLDGAKIQHNANVTGSGLAVNASGAGIKVNMEEGTVIDGNHVGSNHGIFKIYSGTVFTMNGGEVKNTTGWNSNGTAVGLYGGTFIMNGGTICSNSSIYGSSNGRNAAIYLHSNSVMEMNGGTICHNTGLSRGGIDSSKDTSKLTITGGSVVDNVSLAGNSTVDVGGTVGTWSISGGTFTHDVSNWLAPNYGLSYDEATGIYTVTNHVYNLYFRDPATGEQVPGVGPLQGNDLASLIETGKLFYADYYKMELEVLCDVKIDETAVIDYPMTINLNGHTITTVATAAGEYMDAFTILADVTVTGEGKIDARPSHGYTFYVGDKNGTAGNLTIENGTFYGETSVVNNRLGTVTINGGKFAISLENEGDPYDFVLNCVDDNYKAGSAKIVVKGGTFYKFNPENNAAEGTGTNFLPEGYVSEELTTDYFTVRAVNYVAQVGEVKYESLKDALEACTNGETVKLISDITYDDDDVVYAHGGATGFGDYDQYNPSVIYIGGTRVDGVNSPSEVNAVIDLNGHTITNNADAYLFLFMDNCKITFTGEGTVQGNTNAPLIWVTGTDTLVTIESGEYTTVNAEGVMWSTHGGDLVITGGEFRTTADDASLLIIRNEHDRKNSKFFINGKATITVTGGTFYGFNPEKTFDDSTNPFTEFNAVAEGYKAIHNADEDSWTVVNYVEWIKAELLAGRSVTLEQDIVLDDINYVTAEIALSNGNGNYCGFDYGNGAFFNVIGGDVTFDLNGHSITYDIHDDAWCSKRVVSIFYATDSANLNVIDSVGTGTVTVNGMASAAYSVAADTKVTISGGTWTWNPCKTCDATNIFLYASHGGELYITDGTFINNVEGEDGEYMIMSHYSSKETTKNWAGVDYDSTKIEITGGTFHGYNPEKIKYMDNGNGNTQKMDNAVAEGYKAIHNADEDSWTVVDYVEWIKAELLAGRSVTLEQDIVLDGSYIDSIPAPTNSNGKYPNYGIFNVVGDYDVTFDLNGHTITYNGHADFEWNGKTHNSCTVAHGLFFANAGADLTILDSSEEQTGTVMVHGLASGGYVASPDTKLTITGGTWKNDGCAVCDGTNIFMYPLQGGELYITGGLFEQALDSEGESYLLVEHGGVYHNTVIDYAKTKLVVSGGTFVGMNPEEAKYFQQTADNKLVMGETKNVCAEGYFAIDNGDGSWGVVPAVEAGYVAYNVQDNVYFKDLSDALEVANENETVQLLVSCEEALVLVPADVTLDLNGNVVKAGNVLSFGIVLNGQPEVGGIEIPIETSEAFFKLQPENGGYLPIYDTRDGMYKFFEYDVESVTFVTPTNGVTFWTRVVFTNITGYEVLAHTDNSGIDFILTMNWTGMSGFNIRYFMTDDTVKSYAQLAYDQMKKDGTHKQGMSATIYGVDNLGAGASISAAPSIETLAEVTDSAAALVYNIP